MHINTYMCVIAAYSLKVDNGFNSVLGNIQMDVCVCKNYFKILKKGLTIYIIFFLSIKKNSTILISKCVVCTYIRTYVTVDRKTMGPA